MTDLERAVLTEEIWASRFAMQGPENKIRLAKYESKKDFARLWDGRGNAVQSRAELSPNARLKPCEVIYLPSKGNEQHGRSNGSQFKT